MLDEIAIAVFTQDSPLYERIESCLGGLADRIAQLPYHDRIETVRDFGSERHLIVLLDTSREREMCLRWMQKLSEICPDAISVCLES